MASPAPDIYRTLLENLSDGVMVIDIDGSVRIANPALCQMFGLELDEVLNRPFGEIFLEFEGFDDFVQIILDAVVEQGDIERRVTRVRIGDEVRSLSVTTSYLTAAGGNGPGGGDCRGVRHYRGQGIAGDRAAHGQSR